MENYLYFIFNIFSGASLFKRPNCSPLGGALEMFVLPCVGFVSQNGLIRSRFGSSHFWFKRGWIGG